MDSPKTKGNEKMNGVEIIYNITAAVFVIIVLHELGHYIMAKWHNLHPHFRVILSKRIWKCRFAVECPETFELKTSKDVVRVYGIIARFGAAGSLFSSLGIAVMNLIGLWNASTCYLLASIMLTYGLVETAEIFDKANIKSSGEITQ